MKTKSAHWLFLAGIFLLLLTSVSVRAGTLRVFTGVRLIDGTGGAPVEGATLLIRDGQVVGAGKVDPNSYAGEVDKEVIACDGQTIIPGLISDHSHLGVTKGGNVSPENYTPENIEAALHQYEGYGVTTVMALGVNKDLLYPLREAQRAGKLGGAQVFTADRGFGVAQAAPPIPMGSDQIARPGTPEEARQMVREMAARHADMIKVWVDDFFGATEPKMSPEMYGAIIAEAHQNGLRVAAHIFHLDDAKQLLREGVDVIAHSVRDEPVDQEFIDLMKRNHAGYIATLALDEAQFVYAEHPGWMDSAAFHAAVDPKVLATWLSPQYSHRMQANPLTPKNKAALAMGMRNVKALHDAGILIGFGTDSGANPARLPGWAEHRELQLLVAAGLTPMEALVCATRNAAQVLGDVKNRGTLEPGKRADFVLLAANPLEDIRNSTRIVAVYNGGKRIEPAFSVGSVEQPRVGSAAP